MGQLAKQSSDPLAGRGGVLRRKSRPDGVTSRAQLVAAPGGLRPPSRVAPQPGGGPNPGTKTKKKGVQEDGMPVRGNGVPGNRFPIYK